MLALVRRDRLDLGRGLPRVGLLLVALEGLDQVAHRACSEDPREHDDRPDAQAGTADGRHACPELAQLRGPDLGVATLVAGNRPEGTRPPIVLLDPGQGVVQDDRVALELEVLEALLDVEGGHASMVAGQARGCGR